MNSMREAGFGRHGFWKYLLGGVVGGAGAGWLTAYLEVFFLLLTVGSFWVDLPLLIQALALYGLAGGGCGVGCSLVLFPLFFRYHPLRHTRPWVFFFSFFAACGLMLELVVFLLDIHTFRDPGGRWTAAAYLVLVLGLLVSGFIGWVWARAGRGLFQHGTIRSLRKAGIVVAFFGALFLLAGAYAARQERAGLGQLPDQSGDRPANIIILVVDALRPDHLSAYGYPLPTSPAIDRLAGEGVLFRNCYATSTWTVPTHGSLFTGLFPSAHGAYTLYSPVDPAVPTLAKILAGRGYRTGAFYDNPLLGSRYGLLRGFQEALNVDNTHKVSLTLLRIFDRLRGNRSMSRNLLLISGKWIERARKAKRPFFLFVNLLDAHLPYRPKQPYINEFLRSLPDEGVNKDLARKLTTDGIHSKKMADALYSRLGAADWRWLERFYDSNIRAIDDEIGRFLGRLKSGKLQENTMVIVTADHGELFGENGLGGGHYHLSMTQAALHIPLIVWFPGRLPVGEIQWPVSQVEIFANVLRLAGMAGAVPGNVQDADLFSRLPERVILAEFWDDARQCFSRACFSRDLKLIVHSSGKKELYDLKNDPREESDLAPLRPDLVKSLALRLDEVLRSMPQKRSGQNVRNRKETEKLLRSLGYL